MKGPSSDCPRGNINGRCGRGPMEGRMGTDQRDGHIGTPDNVVMNCRITPSQSGRCSFECRHCGIGKGGISAVNLRVASLAS
jgi:hypothetical protein